MTELSNNRRQKAIKEKSRKDQKSGKSKNKSNYSNRHKNTSSSNSKKSSKNQENGKLLNKRPNKTTLVAHTQPLFSTKSTTSLSKIQEISQEPISDINKDPIKKPKE